MGTLQDSVLDAIVMVIASDGEVTEREMNLAQVAARDLPSLRPLGDGLEEALGKAFERFVDEGTAARRAAIGRGAPAGSARLEILLAASVAASVDGPITDGERSCIEELGLAMGMAPDQIAQIIARSAGEGGEVRH